MSQKPWRGWRHIARCALALSFLALGAHAGDPVRLADAENKKFREIFNKSLEAFNAEDLDKAIKLWHPESPYRDQESKRLEATFKTQNQELGLAKLKIVGEDEDFVFAKLSLTLSDRGTPLSEPAQRAESLVTFRRQRSVFKIWGVLSLTAKAP